MATNINDLTAAAIIQPLAPPQEYTADGSGPLVDLGPGDGPCYAVQMVGGVSGGTTLTGRLEESADATTWTTAAGGFAPATTGGIQTVRFARTKRYVRWAFDIDGGEEPYAWCSAVVIQPRKTF